MKSILLTSVLFFSLILQVNFVSAEIKQYVSDDLDMNNLIDVKDKKSRFFNFMRPIIQAENDKILVLRNVLIAAKKANNNSQFVQKTAQQYSVKWLGDESWGKLLERVDAVAMEVALAQSANESAWGQSRFARQGNNMFGQWCYKKGCGIVPKRRDKGSTHEVAKFTSVNKSVASYLKNINTGRVYAPLRDIRKKNRKLNKKSDAIAQAGGLIKYSQRREAYVKEIRAMIKYNKKLMIGL